ncbi:MAG: serine hydrolase [Lewinella sp.]
MRLAVLLSVFLSYAATLSGQQLYFPPVTGSEWRQRSATELGYDTEAIDRLYNYLEQVNSKAFLLLEDGEIVLEHYMNGFGPDSLHYWASAGKTLLSAAVGIAAAADDIDLNASSSDYLGTGWTSCEANEEARITVLDQLRMTTGMDDTGTLGCTDVECLRCVAEPGARWAYHNAPYTLLHDVIEAATGQTPTQYIRRHFRNATGIAGAYLPLGDDLRVFFSTPRVMARFGLLLLAKGRWSNTQLVPADYVSRMSTTSQPHNQSYGLLTWLNGQPTHMLNGSREVFEGPLLADAPSDAYFAAGANGQFLNVVPSRGLVWLRLGDEPSAGTGEYVGADFNNEIWKRVNGVLGDSPTAVLAPVEVTTAAVYPNPARGTVNVRSPEPMHSLELFDFTGRRIRYLPVGGKLAELPVAGESAGIYLLVIHYRSGRMAQAKVSLY